MFKPTNILNYTLRTVLLSVILGFTPFIGVEAQYPVQVTTVIPPPYPQTYEEAIALGDNAFIILQNTDQSSTYEVKLSASISGDNGISASTLPEATPSMPISLGPGETRTLFGVELQALYLNYSSDDIMTTGIDEAELIQNPYLPEGNYTICVQAFEYNSSSPLSNPMGAGCSPPIYVTTIAPPIITYPFPNQELLAMDPQQVVFSWTPVTFNSPDIRYAFQMVDITDLQANPYDLIENADFHYYNEEDILTNNLYYGPIQPILVDGHSYVVRVKAYLLNGELNIENGGFSDLVLFHYTSELFTGGFDDLDDIVNPDPEDDPIDPITEDNDPTLDDGLSDTGMELPVLDDPATESGSGPTTNSPTVAPAPDMGCAAGCNNIPLPVNNSLISELSANSLINIGQFQLQLQTVQEGSPDTWSGTGFIQATDFFPSPVLVQLENARVNTDMQLIAGIATATVRNGSWVDTSWDAIQKNFDEDAFGADAEAFYNNINDPAWRLETWNTLQGSAGITLPVGYGEGDYKVHIVKMEFSPQQAKYDAVVVIPVPDDYLGTEYLSFAASDICLNTTGAAIGTTPLQLDMLNPIRVDFSDKISMGIYPNSSSGASSYVMLDCSGFHKAEISGRVDFSPEWFKVENAQGDLIANDTVSGSFQVEFTEWDNWIGQVTFGEAASQNSANLSPKKFQWTKLKGYTFELETAVIDHSTDVNWDGMAFPVEYQGSKANDWQGVYVQDVSLTLPTWMKKGNDQRATFQANDLMVDASGISGAFISDDLISLDEGDIGGWDFSLDHLALSISSNELLSSGFNGKLKIPITDSVLTYQANLQFIENKTEHSFAVYTTSSINFPAFLSDLSIEPNSSVTVEVDDNDDVLIEATLHGKMDLPEQIDQIPGCDLKDISFQDLVIRNQAEPEYIEFGTFGTQGMSLGVAIVGFAASLVDIAIDAPDPDTYELGFDLEINLGEGAAQVSGMAGMMFVAKRFGLPSDIDLRYDRLELDAFQVSGELPGVAVDASVAFFDNDALGQGFAGSFQATFLEAAEVQAMAMFGTTEMGNSRKKFFLVEGLGRMPSPLPFAGPMAMYSLGGGLYFNMARKPNAGEYDLVSATQPITAQSLSDRYEFQEGMLGLMARTQVGLIPPDVFNADAQLTVEINTQSWGLNSVNFLASGYMMTSLNDRSKTPVRVDGVIDYNHPNQTLFAGLSIDIRVPFENPILTSNPNGQISFLASPGLWYLKFGTPPNPIGATLDMAIYSLSMSGYFMAGQELEPPAPLPEEIADIGFTPSVQTNALASGNGVAFGARMDLNLLDIDVVVAELWLTVMAGFDVTVMDYSLATCNGQSDFGINKWYTNGQGYILGNGGLTVLDIEVLEVTAALIVEGGFPAPSGIKGHVHLSVETFFHDFTVDESFEVGEICVMEPMVGADGLQIVITSPVEEMDLIESMSPNSQASNVSLWEQPQIVFATDPDEVLFFAYPDGLGGIFEEEIRFHRFVDWEEMGGNGYFDRITYIEDWDEQTLTLTLTAKDDPNAPTLQSALYPNRQHRLTARMSAQIRNEQGQWEDMLYRKPEKAGQPIVEEQVHAFMTGGSPTTIELAHVDYCRPFDRQRYVTPLDYVDAHMQFNASYMNIFNSMVEDNNAEFVAKFYALDSNVPIASLDINYNNALYTFFDLPTLSPETVYKVVFTAVSDNPFPEEYSPDFSNLASNNLSNDVDTDLSDNNLTSDFSYGGLSYSSEASGYGGLGSVSSNTSFSDTEYSAIGIQATSNDYTVSEIGFQTTPEYTREMYHWYFRTSQFASLQDKLDTYSIANFEVQEVAAPQTGYYGLSQSSTYTRVRLDFDGGEPFDEFDIFGHPYVNAPFSNETVNIVMMGRDDYPGWPYHAGRLGCPNPIQVQDILNGPPSYGPPPVDPAFCDISYFRQVVSFEASMNGMTTSYPTISRPLTESEIGVSSSGGGLYSGFYSAPNINLGGSDYTYSIFFDGELSAKRCYESCDQDQPFPELSTGAYTFKIFTYDLDGSSATETAETDLPPIQIEF